MRYIIIFVIGFSVGKWGFQKTVTTTANTTATVLENGSKAVDKSSELVDNGKKKYNNVKEVVK